MTPTLAGMFAAGLFTFGTPCVLPVIPVYLSVLLGGTLANAGKTERLVLLARSAFFTLGFVLVFTLLGVGASALGGVLVRHQALLQVTGGLVVLLFGLKFLGYLQVPLLDRTLKLEQRGLGLGPLGAFGMGVIFALGWSPCVGPMLGAVLTYTATTTAEPLVGATYLATYGAGFALPLLGVAAFAEAGVRVLRRTSRFLPVMERATGGLLVAVSLGMIYGNVAGGGLSFDPGFALTAPEPRDRPQGGLPTGGPALVEFYEADCPVCKKMAPLLAALKSDCQAKGVSVVQIDVSRPENRHFVREYALRGVPTFVGWDAEGAVQARLVGEQTPKVLIETLSNLSGALCTTAVELPPPGPEGESTCRAPLEGGSAGCAL